MPPSRKANIKLGNPSTDTKPRMFKITAIKIDKINPLNNALYFTNRSPKKIEKLLFNIDFMFLFH